MKLSNDYLKFLIQFSKDLIEQSDNGIVIPASELKQMAKELLKLRKQVNKLSQLVDFETTENIAATFRKAAEINLQAAKTFANSTFKTTGEING